MDLESGPEDEVDSVEVSVQARDAAVAHDEAVLVVDADHEQQPDHVVRLLQPQSTGVNKRPKVCMLHISGYWAYGFKSFRGSR